MSYDLSLGFMEGPKNLDGILSQLGFKHERDFKAGRLQCSSYEFYQEGKSFNPVEFIYKNGTDDLEFWQSVEPSVIAEATITARGNPGTFDFQKQMEFAKYLRDYYGAFLIDPQQMDREKIVIRY